MHQNNSNNISLFFLLVRYLTFVYFFLYMCTKLADLTDVQDEKLDDIAWTQSSRYYWWIHI